MNIPFENFVRNLENQSNPDQKFSLAEKAILKLGVTFIKILLWKVKKVKTYKDAYKIIKWFEFNGTNFMEGLEKKYSEDKYPLGEHQNEFMGDLTNFVEKTDKEL